MQLPTPVTASAAPYQHSDPQQVHKPLQTLLSWQSASRTCSRRQLIKATLLSGCAADCQPAQEAAELLYNSTVSSHIRRGASMPTTFAPPGRQGSPKELTARRSSWPSELPHSGMALFARPQVRFGCTFGSSKAASTLQVWRSIALDNMPPQTCLKRVSCLAACRQGIRMRWLVAWRGAWASSRCRCCAGLLSILPAATSIVGGQPCLLRAAC